MIGNSDEIMMDKEHKALGIAWNTEMDTISISFRAVACLRSSSEFTERNVLKVAVKLFDPLGLVSPVTLQLKLLYQELCASNCDWDEKISDEHNKLWRRWINDI